MRRVISAEERAHKALLKRAVVVQPWRNARLDLEVPGVLFDNRRAVSSNVAMPPCVCGKRYNMLLRVSARAFIRSGRFLAMAGVYPLMAVAPAMYSLSARSAQLPLDNNAAILTGSTARVVGASFLVAALCFLRANDYPNPILANAAIGVMGIPAAVQLVLVAIRGV